MKIRTFILGLMATCASGAIASVALADPPGRVGRISYVEGEVSFLPPGESEWTEATRNFPVAEGESFWTGDRGRTELQIGGIEARLDSETELDVLDLDYGQTRLSLPQGSLDLRVWDAPRGGVVVSTPAGDVRVYRSGVYRIDVGVVGDDGAYPPVEVTVFQGSAEVPGPDGFNRLDSSEAALLSAGYDPELVDPQDAAIDDWAREREARERWSRHAYLSPGLTGYQDLDGYGDFVQTADYGQIWFPRDVPPGWAPYRYGHWAFVRPWGWTWIDDQPWGFAPFHYGRWARVGGRWGWSPGRAAPEPVYAPALVAFIGGRGWSVGFSSGGSGEAVGWVPLAPDEIYRPTYHVSNTYIRQVNVTNVRETTIDNITVNNVTNVVNVNQYRNAPAATVVRSESFTRGASVQRAAVGVPAAALVHAPLATEANRPVPTAMARSGVAPKPGAPAGEATRPLAPPPPPRLQAVRAAVAAQPQGSNKPPVIAGAQFKPTKPAPTGAAVPTLIAPAQVRNPLAQARKPILLAPTAAPTTGGPPPLTRKAPMRMTPIPPAPSGAAERSSPALPPAALARPSADRPPAPDAQARRQTDDQAAREAAARARAEAQVQQQAEQARLQAERQRAADAQAAAAQQSARRAEDQALAQTAAQAQQRAEQARIQAERQRATDAQAAVAKQSARRAEDQARAQAAAQAQAQAASRQQAEQRARAEAQRKAAVEAQQKAQAEQDAKKHKPPADPESKPQP